MVMVETAAKAAKVAMAAEEATVVNIETKVVMEELELEV